MRISGKRKLSNASIGIFLTLMTTNLKNSFLEWESATPFRIHATLFLPADNPKVWMSDLKLHIMVMENGKHLTVNLDWQNCKAFFTYQQLTKFDRELAFLSFHVYNAGELLRCTLDTDSIYKRYRKTKDHEKYLQGKIR